MNREEYLDNILSDAQCWIEENINYYDNFDSAYDDMEYTITGNDSGAYYPNSYQAEEALMGVLWDENVINELEVFGYNGMPTHLGAETCDILVRMVLLPWLHDELEEYWNDLKGDIDE